MVRFSKFAVLTAFGTGGALLAPTFVAPRPKSCLPDNIRPSDLVRVPSAYNESGVDVSCGGSASLHLSAAGAILVAALATGRRKQAGKTTRSFFGGGGETIKSFDPATEIGVQEPLGFWDPLGFTADGDEAAFKRRRSVELKHGRIAMLAAMGYITPYYFKFPGYLSPSQSVAFSDVPNGLAAISKVPGLGWVQIIFFLGVMEGKFGFSDYKTGTPGEYGWTVLTSSDPEEKSKKLSAELANGRLAMMAIIGMFFQDGLTGSAWGDWALYTASPLRAKTARNFFGGGGESFKSFDPTTELGVQEPLGFWDPLGFTADGDEAAFKRRRSVELKHGRIAMLAAMGYITPYYFKFPGYLSPSQGVAFSDVPNGLAAISKVPGLGWVQIIFFLGVMEGKFGFSDYKTGTPGEYGWTVLTSSDPEEKSKKLSAELANGRLAMMAIIGMFFQDGLTGSAWGDWALYTASPLRAKTARNFFGGGGESFKSFDPATELGVQEPLGFWDPLGFTADGDEAAFKRRRSVELKHGRIAMLAAMGYITPYYFKFPGYLSPSQGVAFSDVPNGLAAISKVPGLGWVQIIFFLGVMEGKFGFSDYKTGTPGEYGWTVLTSSDPEEKSKKLSAELANGRLAMMAIIGMFFQDGLTGSAWGDWALYTASPLRAEPVTAAAGAAAAKAAVAAGAKAAAGAKTVGATVGAGAGLTGKQEDEETGSGGPFGGQFDPAKQIGITAPLGYFDPAGFCKVGDESGFKNLRRAEIKHGRVAMMAALGAVIQHYIQFPGFDSVPKGLGAVTEAPGSYGFAALFLISGLLETTAWTEKETGEPGDFGDPLGLASAGLGAYDEEFRNRELNNGRAAMFAALGIIAAELYSGKDAIEQFGL